MDPCPPHLTKLKCNLPECPTRLAKVATPVCNVRQCPAAASPFALSPTPFAPAKLQGDSAAVPVIDLSEAIPTTTADLHQHRVALAPLEKPWLDTSKPYNEVYFKTYGPALDSLSDSAVNPTYYTLSRAGERGLERATNDLHAAFTAATRHVLRHVGDGVAAHFGLPAPLWPLIQRSWEARAATAAAGASDILSGRLDWALTPEGVKVYEYNADSASCFLEAGEVQGAWAAAAGLGSVGLDAGRGVFAALVAGFKALRIGGVPAMAPVDGASSSSTSAPASADGAPPVVLHMMIDEGGEERYHALYMQAAATTAGITTKLVVGRPAELGWVWAPDGSGRVVDSDGVIVSHVWKTWSWNTVIDAASDADYAYLNALLSGGPVPPPPSPVPALQHVLLDPRIRVFEPLWTVLPSSKAILPVLSALAPTHPALLKSSFSLTPELRAAGYVTKPINGRAGRNVEIFAGKEAQQAQPQAQSKSPQSSIAPRLQRTEGAGAAAPGPSDSADCLSSAAPDRLPPLQLPLEAATSVAPSDGAIPAIEGPDSASSARGGGEFSSRDLMYQELCVLPLYDGHFVQANTCVVGGRFAGTVLRCSDTAVVDYGSNIYALRVVD